MGELDNTILKVDLTDMCRTFHQKRGEYTFVSYALEIFSMIEHMLDHKKSD